MSAAEGPRPSAATEAGRGADLFRQQALAHRAGPAGEGDVLRLPPTWTRWTYWLLLALVAAGLSFVVLGRVRQWAGGPAVIRLEARADLTAPLSGTVAAVEVRPGERVAAGRILLRFRSEREAAEYARLRREFEARLAERLRDPADPEARRVLLPLRAELELAAANLEARLVRAPRDAIVRDVMVEPGRFVEEGRLLFSLDPGDAGAGLLALLPGEHRPLLDAGMRLRLELRGRSRAREWTTIEDVGERVLGPAEARRLLGPEIADAVELTGPVIAVRARLPQAALRAGSETYTLHDGMLARAEVPLRSEPILFALFPALRNSLGS